MAAVENKVTGAVVGAGSFTVIANFVLWLLATYASADAASDPAVVGFVNFAVASAGAFVVGYYARHTTRMELNASDADEGNKEIV